MSEEKTPESWPPSLDPSTPVQYEGMPEFPQNTAAHDNVPDAAAHISLTEAPTMAPDGSVGIRVNVEQIMDQVHQHWANMMAGQIQRNAELSAALTSVNDELTEVRAKLAALTQVTNAPEGDTAGRVRQIPPTMTTAEAAATDRETLESHIRNGGTIQD